MADQEYDPDVLKNQRDLNQAGSEYLGIQKEILSTMKKMAEYQASSASEQRKIEQTMSAGTKLAKMLEGFSREDIRNAKKREAFLSKYNEFKSKELDMQEDIVELLKDGSEESKILAKKLKDAADNGEELAKEASKMAKEIEKANKVTGLFEGFENLVKDIPVVRSLFSSLTKGSKVAAENFSKTGDGIQATLAGLGSVGSGIMSMLTTTFIGALIKGLVGIDEATVNLTRSLGLGTKASSAYVGELQKFADGRVTFDRLAESAQAITDALGAAVPPSGETVRQVTILADRLGISAQQSAELYKLSALTGQSFNDTTNSIISQTKALNLTGDVTLNYRDILKDVASASSATLLTTEKFPGGIARAAYQARKFGLSLQVLNSSSGNLLNFQESIGAELEAELLTGRQLNLNKAREAALMGDQATLAEEISKNVGSAAEFGKMNVLQQEAVAKAVGLSREELAKSLNQREALLKLEKETGIAGISRMDTEQQIAALMEQGKTRAEALRALGEQEMADQAEAITAREALTNAMKDLGTKLAELIQALTGENNPLKLLTDAILKLTDFLGGKTKDGKSNIAGVGGGVLGGYGGLKLAKMFGTSGKVGKAAGSALLKAGAGKGLAKFGGVAAKGILGKAVPGLALGMAMTDLFQGDYTGAALNTVAGIASFFPGVGSAISAGIGAIDIIRETAGGGYDPLGGSHEIPAEDFTIKTHPKDTLVMAGGTKFGEETNTLLKELITAVKSGGHVYLDGRKVGESLALSYTNQ